MNRKMLGHLAVPVLASFILLGAGCSDYFSAELFTVEGSFQGDMYGP